MRAAIAGKVDVVIALLEGGANVDLPGPAGHTPLMRAAIAGKVDVVKALLEGGASVDLPDPAGHTPLMRAAKTGKADVISALIEFGSNKGNMIKQLMASSLPNKETILLDGLLSSKSKPVEVMAILSNPYGLLSLNLINKTRIRAYLNQADDLGVTNFSKIVKHGDIRLVRSALHLGADPRVNSRGRALKDIATTAGLPVIARLLKNAREDNRSFASRILAEVRNIRAVM